MARIQVWFNNWKTKNIISNNRLKEKYEYLARWRISIIKFHTHHNENLCLLRIKRNVSQKFILCRECILLM